METTTIETKVVNPKTFLYHEGKTNLKNIMEYANPVVYDFYEELNRSGVQATGPLEFIYLGVTDDPEKEFTLQVAIPVEEEKPVSNGYRFKKADAFKCVSYDYKGEVNKMMPVYENLFQQIFAAQLKPNDEVREVYRHWEHPESENNITEIQIGVN